MLSLDQGMWGLCHHLVAAYLIAVTPPNHRICIVATIGKSSFPPFSALENVLIEGMPSTRRVAGLACSLWRSAQVDAFAQPSFFQIRLRCQKGIPPSLRGRAWQYLSGGKVKLQQNPGKFDVSFPSLILPFLPHLLSSSQ